MLNKCGEITHLCLTPFFTRNPLDSVPATFTFACCLQYNLFHKLIICAGKPFMSLLSTVVHGYISMKYRLLSR